MASYWLFKTEPAEYSITDLAGEPGATVRWDGIRNYQARNHLRDDIAKGDQVLIYHSSCKVPGIAGTAKVVSAPYPDPSQFDPNSPYYDAKSSVGAPRWFCVDICHQSSFDNVIPVSRLRTVQALAEMVLFRQGRLSVQPVSEGEWQILVELGLHKRHPVPVQE
ncbi:MAG: EVE domain-containing protein [Porticoccaceae bacterium]|nr:EVE domain-containing protein [Porticoccaceae bacterium]